ncbi:PaaI family thioesterase [Streptomyces luteolus]|uniref:PaaI family thioesterase n=1 Tax=Streptomyces luteolus TaxID=3043615 RepID=A0ABT6TA10_9ACTN|nr:PaaI family thioesterase [Streptomyces sp. B-S-A12]MDI3423864.1 PaaI family thioesterase [Streptomyces sp. B-S-A12]
MTEPAGMTEPEGMTEPMMPLTRTHTWLPPLPPESLAGFSGEQLLREILEGRVPPPPIASTLGIELLEVRPGEVEFEGESGGHLLNGYGMLFGGYLASLLDCALGSAVLTLLPAGTGQTTVQMNVNIVRPAHAGTGPLRCVGRALHVGRSIATSEATVTGAGDGKLYAHGTTTCAVVGRG